MSDEEKTLRSIWKSAVESVGVAVRTDVCCLDVLRLDVDGQWVVMRLGSGEVVHTTVRFRVPAEDGLGFLRDNFVGWRVEDVEALPFPNGWGFQWTIVKKGQGVKVYDMIAGERQVDNKWDFTIRSAALTTRIGHDGMPHLWHVTDEDNTEGLRNA